MHKINLLYIMIGLLCLTYSCSKPSTVDSGVSITLAMERKSLLENIHYDLFFSVPAQKTDSIYAKEKLFFHLNKKTNHLLLDFKESSSLIKSIYLNDQEINPEFLNEHIILPGNTLRQGKNKLEIQFIAGNLSLNRQDEFLYTLFVPDRARTAFPCFDQPDLKAEFTLSLEIPEEWTAVANGKSLETATLNSRKTIHFQKTKKLPTYLFAFVAGKFQQIERTQGEHSVSLFHRETDTQTLNRNLDEIFRQVFTSLEWMEEYTGIPYPFAKYDLIAIPSFQYGGMEHTGATLYRSSRIILPESPTQDQLLSRANLIAHETAHMWFGDLVTMKWFSEVWLKEVFANFIAEKITNPWFPDINHELKFLLAHYPEAYEIDRSTGANPVLQKLENLEDAGTVYGSIIYHKAPLVMKKLEEITGEDEMQKGLQKYLKLYAYDNASWDQLIDILSENTSFKLKQWSRVWIEEAGMPHYLISEENDSLSIQQSDPHNENRIWPDKLQVLADSLTTELSFSASTPVNQIKNSGDYFLNSAGMCYGKYIFPDPKQEFKRFESAYHNLDDLNKASQWLIWYENLLEGRIETVDFLNTSNQLLRNEANPLIIQLIIDQQKTAYWSFLPENQRPAMEDSISKTLLKILDSVHEKSKKAVFTHLANLSLSEQNLDIIESARSTGKYKNLSFSENERTNFCYQLMLKRPEHYERLLNQQLTMIKNNDRLEEFRFITPSLHPDRKLRQNFFLSLELPENRETESWVIEAVAWLNHPLRQHEEVNNLYRYLELLPEIKETGDIFFPKRWLDATLKGHNSKEARLIVDNFLQNYPSLSPSLEAKLKQSADMLYRAEKYLHSNGNPN